MRLLVVGVNTRPVVNSAKRLGFEVYSVSYYNPVDLNADKKIYFIDDYNHGHFRENYSEDELLKAAEKFVDEVDGILITSGIFEDKNSKTPNWDVIGNPPKKIKRMSNKYNTIKRLENLGYNVPLTYLAKNYSQLERYLDELKIAILKPISGSGGIGVTKISFSTIENMGAKEALEELNINIEFPILVQEYINSESFSASFIDTNFITFNRQIIENNMYVGNITPYSLNGRIFNVSKAINDFREIIETFELKGMNGIDFMIKDNEVCIIEINPRILGTFETIEKSAGVNLVKHIIEGKSANVRERFIKRIVFAKEKIIAKIKKKPFVYDIPKYNAVIEKNEPIATVIAKTNINHCIDSIYKECVEYEAK
ncbi:ATP-grasp domain-containing protein [Methanotorris igneus]|uniref:ATP-grasp fold domain protein, DUF201-type n=1 Tax=Methanotorris igneus (strain DSM 5666 / JCM 11834 / Kol 5) TaxID=880724 RepID=F6BDW7_METIK|nr:ATP-grasp domain-containing protein [Methanotorris igneus]AEF96678.1 ATP-grasp fold domain protein, DUF201-type [Methanotorris igneus Kol 5]